MFELKLKLSKGRDGNLHLHFPLLFRLTLYVLAGLLISAMILNRRLEVLPVILTAVSLLGGLYTEHWTFNPQQGEIIHRYGIAPLTRKVRFSLSEIENFTLHRFYKGRMALPVPPGGSAGGPGSDHPRRTPAGPDSPSAPGSSAPNIPGGPDGVINSGLGIPEQDPRPRGLWGRMVQKTIYSLSFEHIHQGRVVIESQSNKQMEQWAWSISRHCRLPLGFDDQRGSEDRA
ncbi:hypothetical protein [Spirochaeta lutea]|nr:hypothetical protein [Spirochaeta lutea]